MCQYDYDQPSFVAHSSPQARKRHRCDECRRFIEPGERYFRTSGKWDGLMQTFVMCVQCDKGRQLLVKECKGYLFQGVQEDLEEHARARLPWSMKAARLVIGMKRKWQRFDRAGLMNPKASLA